MRHRLAALLIVPFAILFAAVPASAESEHAGSPGSYYLALGDSLAYGFQQAKFLAESPNVNAATFNTGYVDDFTARLKELKPRIQTVNLGCPGETTSSFTGTCPFPAVWLHSPYPTSQEAAALAFLQLHRGRVNPITIDLGANDVLGLVSKCTTAGAIDISCVTGALPGVVATLEANLKQELRTLRKAAPRSEIIVMELYNPLVVVDPRTDAFEGMVNEAIGDAADANRARVAEAFPVINQSPLFPSEFAAVCGLTGMCVPPGGDVHPNDAGYAAIAQQFWQASGFAREEDD